MDIDEDDDFYASEEGGKTASVEPKTEVAAPVAKPAPDDELESGEEEDEAGSDDSDSVRLRVCRQSIVLIGFYRIWRLSQRGKMEMQPPLHRLLPPPTNCHRTPLTRSQTPKVQRDPEYTTEIGCCRRNRYKITCSKEGDIPKATLWI